MEETATAPSIKSVSTVEIYDRWAESYDALASPKGVTIQTLDNDELVTLLPEFLSLLGVQQTSVSTLDHQLRIVDFGCGTGRNTFKLLRVPHATIVGLDASPGMLDIARARYAQIPDEQKNVHVVLEVYDALATAEAPACARKANGVISTCVMQHLPLQAFFDSIKAMVLPGGYVLITDSHPELNNAVQIKYTDPQTGEKLWGTSYIHEIATTIESAARWGFDLVGKVKERNGLENMVGALAGNWTAVKCWYGMVLRRRSETRTAPFSSADYQFRGWMAEDASAIHGNLKFRSYKPKPWLETDVDIKIICCGVCGSDMHTIRDGYNATDWPCCPGHEVVGTVVKVGNRVAKSIKYVIARIDILISFGSSYV
jgi:SAM-dependent methyltransferase